MLFRSLAPRASRKKRLRLRCVQRLGDRVGHALNAQLVCAAFEDALLSVPGADAVVDDIAESYDQPSGDVRMTAQQPFFPAHVAVGIVQQFVQVTE